MLSTFQTLSYLILTTNPGGIYYYYLHFPGEEKSTERANNLSRVTQLVQDRAGDQAQPRTALALHSQPLYAIYAVLPFQEEKIEFSMAKCMSPKI